jgi:hypothetical protein
MTVVMDRCMSVRILKFWASLARFVGLRQLSDPEELVSEEEPSLPKSWECLPWERTG